jgi:hypothetical protein
VARSSRRRQRRFAIAAAAIVATPLFIACNSIVGLDEYQKVDCTPGHCDGGLDAVSADVAADTNRSDVVVIVDAGGTSPVAWANFKMPNYVPTGADAASVDNKMFYAPATGGFADGVTGRVWYEAADMQTAPISYADAQKYCAGLKVGGTWRLPTRIELVSLLDLTRVPAAAAQFATMRAQAYWTSSEVRPFGADRKHWTVSFAGDAVLSSAPEGGGIAGVRCILAQ